MPVDEPLEAVRPPLHVFVALLLARAAGVRDADARGAVIHRGADDLDVRLG